MDFLKKHREWAFFAAGAICLLLAGALLWSLTDKWKEKQADDLSLASFASGAPSGKNSSSDAPSSNKVRSTEWVLYITGAVRHPGIYSVPAECRLYQLVDLAGGMTENADREGINLAEKLSDGLHVHVPRKGEIPRPTVGTSTNPHVNPPCELAERATPEGASSVTVIDLNTADQSALEMLPGVGPKTAQAILEYRNQHGRFEKVEELLNVKGIGPKKFEKIRSAISVSP